MFRLLNSPEESDNVLLDDAAEDEVEVGDYYAAMFKQDGYIYRARVKF